MNTLEILGNAGWRIFEKRSYEGLATVINGPNAFNSNIAELRNPITEKLQEGQNSYKWNVLA
jgi:hypothetical protein